MFIAKAYNYLNSVLATNGTSKRGILTLVIVMFITLMGSETSDETSVLISMGSFDMLMVVSCMAAAFMSQVKNGGVELRNVLPVSRRRRVIYDYLLPIATAAVVLVMFIVFTILLFVAISLLIWLFSGENPFVYEEDSYTSFSCLGFLATFFRFVLIYSLCQIIAHADKYWWAALIVTGVVNLAWTLIPVGLASTESVSYSYYMSFGVLNNGWLYVLVSGIISAAVLALSVIFVSRTYKPKDF